MSSLKEGVCWGVLEANAREAFKNRSQGPGGLAHFCYTPQITRRMVKQSRGVQAFRSPEKHNLWATHTVGFGNPVLGIPGPVLRAKQTG